MGHWSSIELYAHADGGRMYVDGSLVAEVSGDTSSYNINRARFGISDKPSEDNRAGMQNVHVVVCTHDCVVDTHYIRP